LDQIEVVALEVAEVAVIEVEEEVVIEVALEVVEVVVIEVVVEAEEEVVEVVEEVELRHKLSLSNLMEFISSKVKRMPLLHYRCSQVNQFMEKKKVTAERDGEKVEYRQWNPYRSKIGAAIVGGIPSINFGPGSKVLYLGAATGTTCSHVADICGNTGIVYAVEFSARCGRDLINMAKKRTNIVPLVNDARRPWEYRFFMEMCDFVFADVAQPDQARIVGLNCKLYLKNGGYFMIAIKASCIDSTLDPEVVFQNEINKLKEEGLKPKRYMSLEPYQKDHAIVLGEYRPE